MSFDSKYHNKRAKLSPNRLKENFLIKKKSKNP